MRAPTYLEDKTFDDLANDTLFRFAGDAVDRLYRKISADVYRREYDHQMMDRCPWLKPEDVNLSRLLAGTSKVVID